MRAEYKPVFLRLDNGKLHRVTLKSWLNFLLKLERNSDDPFLALRNSAIRTPTVAVLS